MHFLLLLANQVPQIKNTIKRMNYEYNNTFRAIQGQNNCVVNNNYTRYHYQAFQHPVKVNECEKKFLLRNVIIFENHKENDIKYCLRKTIEHMGKVGKLDIKFNKDNNNYCYVFKNRIIAEGSGESKMKAKKAADEELLKVLRENCYTIKTKVHFFSADHEIRKTGNLSINGNKESNQIQEDNLGYKLLQKLGWKGGSLGANGNGIIDPIESQIKIGRRGFGSNECKANVKNDDFDRNFIQNVLENYQRNQIDYDLIFSAEFSKEERSDIHM